MRRCDKAARVWRGGVLLGVLLGGTLLSGVQAWASDGIKGVTKFNPADETVALFRAVEEGKLEAKLIPKDSSVSRLLITNKSGKPLNVRMPEAFAGVPVLAQMFPFPANNNQNNTQSNNNSRPQTLGIGNRQGVQGNNPMFNAPPRGRNRQPAFAPFNIAPDKAAQLKLECVCLEHGKPTPRAAMPYAIRPLADVTEKKAVHALCGLLGRGEVGQRAAQAAAWHLNNNMSWQALANKRQQIGILSITRPYFTLEELAEAKQAVEKAEALVERDGNVPKEKYDSLSAR